MQRIRGRLLCWDNDEIGPRCVLSMSVERASTNYANGTDCSTGGRLNHKDKMIEESRRPAKNFKLGHMTLNPNWPFRENVLTCILSSMENYKMLNSDTDVKQHVGLPVLLLMN